jgi:hypothetical protein
MYYSEFAGHRSWGLGGGGAKNGPRSHVNSVQLGRHVRNRTNVWSYANGPGFGRAADDRRRASR